VELRKVRGGGCRRIPMRSPPQSFVVFPGAWRAVKIHEDCRSFDRGQK
jgi:hypothetical protein